MTCARTQGFLARKKVETATRVDARKTRLTRKDALALLKGVDVVYSARRGQVERVSLGSDRPDDNTLAGLLLGPTGNLRAPALLVGRTLVVGFDEATYRRVLG